MAYFKPRTMQGRIPISSNPTADRIEDLKDIVEFQTVNEFRICFEELIKNYKPKGGLVNKRNINKRANFEIPLLKTVKVFTVLEFKKYFLKILIKTVNDPISTEFRFRFVKDVYRHESLYKNKEYRLENKIGSDLQMYDTEIYGKYYHLIHLLNATTISNHQIDNDFDRISEELQDIENEKLIIDSYNALKQKRIDINLLTSMRSKLKQFYGISSLIRNRICDKKYEKILFTSRRTEDRNSDLTPERIYKNKSKIKNLSHIPETVYDLGYFIIPCDVLEFFTELFKSFGKIFLKHLKLVLKAEKDFIQTKNKRVFGLQIYEYLNRLSYILSCFETFLMEPIMDHTMFEKTSYSLSYLGTRNKLITEQTTSTFKKKFDALRELYNTSKYFKSLFDKNSNDIVSELEFVQNKLNIYPFKYYTFSPRISYEIMKDLSLIGKVPKSTFRKKIFFPESLNRFGSPAFLVSPISLLISYYVNIQLRFPEKKQWEFSSDDIRLNTFLMNIAGINIPNNSFYRKGFPLLKKDWNSESISLNKKAIKSFLSTTLKSLKSDRRYDLFFILFNELYISIQEYKRIDPSEFKSISRKY